ncbi:MAG TPA: proprotein convertase P-domain-containing protein, partial [Pyrinomonadaceae bacterium]|nr:proprotein convertase P-domain-containing protein [Pyrinomonadaceae bacterium]
NTSIPPDTHGAVGPSHLMVTLNTQIRIQNRAGANLSTVSLDSFWAALGNPNTFDPKILYDPYNARWIFTVVADPEAATSAVLVAVSQTSDPTGNWNLYKVDVDPTDAAWADYPSLGFNKNWIVVTVNMFGVSGNNFQGSHIYVFDKANLYAGTGSFKLFTDTNGATMTPAITYDNALNTLYLVEDWDGHTQLRLSSITGTAASPTYSSTHTFPTVPEDDSWAFNPDESNFAPQLGSNEKIMANDSRIQNVVYRNGSLWCVQTVFLPNAASPTRSSIQWWQLTTAGAIQQRGRVDDPAGLNFYGFPTIAVNVNNDVLIGYSRFSSQQYASANYSFRAGSDPTNTLRDDTVLKAGSAPYFKDFGTGRNRWGDYSNTVVDPLNDLDMWTIQEHAAAVSGGVSRWGTWWGRISPGPSTPTPFIQLGKVTATDGNTGDDNTLIDPGETGNKLTLQLKNTGSASATAVSATLTTSSAGVTVTQNTSAYPNLAAGTGAGNNTTPFQFNVGPSFACGQNISFTLTVTYTGGGSPVSLSFTVPTGTPGTAVTRTRTGSAVTIPDNSTTGVNIPLSVSGFTGRISDLDFKLGGSSCSTDALSTSVGLNHSWVGDLVVTLKSPQGTVVTLIDRAGGVNNEGHNFCNTTLDDESAGSSIEGITPEQAPYTGTFKPAGPLSAFDGENPNGTWTLNVSDRAAEDTGSLRTFSLVITPYTCSTTITPATYSISGKVTKFNGGGLSGVTVTLSGSSAATTTTLSDGIYKFTGLAAGGTYTVRPSKEGVIFTPAYRTFARLNSDKTGTATVFSALVSIGGVVKLGTAGLGGVSVRLTSPSPAGFTPRTATTTSAGVYKFANLPLGRTYVVTPTRTNYSFTPATCKYYGLSASQTAANFAATLKTYKVSGLVTMTGTTTGIASVTMTITSPTPAGFSPRTVRTGSGGSYTFSSLPAGRSYTIKAAKTGYTFTPTSRSISKLSGNASAGATTNFSGSGP